MIDQSPEARKSRIGGTDIAVILGLSPWKTPYQLWLEKTSSVATQATNEAMRYGIMMEPVIRDWYINETGILIQVPNSPVVHAEFDYCVASVDGIAFDRVLEIKTSKSDRDWGEPGSDEIPVYYRTQVEWYLAICNRQIADVVVLFPGRMPLIYRVEADKELQSMLFDAAHDFWRRVQENDPPPISTFTDVQLRFGHHSTAGEITASASIEYALAELKDIQTTIKELEDKATELKTGVLSFMGDLDTIVDLAGNRLATWKLAKGSKRFDVDAFKTAQPELYEQFVVTKNGSRRFIIK